MVRNLLALTGLLAIALAAAVGIQAYSYDRYDDPPPRVAVSYAGLDLADPEARRVLEGRINRAIAEVCPRDTGSLIGHRYDRECRKHAIAGVEPQVDAAVARAEERAQARREAIAYAEADMALPPLRPRAARPAYDPTPEQAYAPPSADPPLRLVRRTVTRTVTTTVPAPPAVKAIPAHRAAHKSARHVKHSRPVRGNWVRHTGPGTWLPPYAWPAIERATWRAVVLGRTVHWSARERSGYVTVSAARWIKGCPCRNVRVVKHAEGRHVVVAEGMRCRKPTRR